MFVHFSRGDYGDTRPRGGCVYPRTLESLPISTESYIEIMVCIWLEEWHRIATPGRSGLEGLWHSR